MRRADVVIGAGYGDEGKGAFTDFLAAKAPGTLVVRFNGGAQAGHTVSAPDGRRHVFSHFGAGTLAGAATFLSRFFVANPVTFGREADLLAGLGVAPDVILDPDAPVTTPYDMILNRAAEAARGAGRHGSCGIGFGETLERHLRAPFALRARDLDAPARVADRLRAIRAAWLPERARALSLPAFSPEMRALLASDALIDRFLHDAERLLAGVRIAGAGELARAGRVVFEGAQGLLLDQDRGAFPHVTRSNTGLRNVLPLAREAGIGALDVHYVTRAYVTRHGAGPLAHELPGKPFPGVEDATNQPNPHQGSLRFAWLDLDILAGAVAADLSDARGAGLRVGHDAVVTCLDQVAADVTVVEGGAPRTAGRDDLPLLVARRIGAAQAGAGWGPTRDGLARQAPSRTAA